MMDLNQYMQRAQRGVYTNAMTAFALLLSLASTALVAQDAGKPAFTSHRVTQSTAMLEPADTNGNVGVFFWRRGCVINRLALRAQCRGARRRGR